MATVAGVLTAPAPATRVAGPDVAAGGGTARMGYQPALDGLRAVAVIAVLLYHADLRWIPGGFLGVEVFFVISGFLITALLLEERARTGRTDLRQFWVRRARRLLPAMWLLLVAVSAYALAFLPEVVHALRADVVAAFAYVTNWWLIASEQSYFAALDRPPLLRHLWSLAVEEQWYLLWPLAFVVLACATRGRRTVMAAVLGALAVASAVWMAVLFEPDADPSRVYYGTDTRAQGLLLGAALACVWSPWRSRRATAAPGAARVPGAPLLAASGVVALVVLGVLAARVDEQLPFLYQGGFALTAVVTLVAIAAATHPGTGWFRTVLGCRPLVWVGVRSYGLYLWHWPVYVVLRPQDTGWGPLPTLAARLAITVVLTELSFRLVETPVRSGALGRWVTRLRAPGRPVVALQGAVAAVVVSLLVLGGMGAAMARAVPGEGLISAEAAPSEISAPSDPAAPPPASEPDASPAEASPAEASPAEASPDATGAVAVGRPVQRITVVGDSVGMTLARNAPAAIRSEFAVVDGAIEGCGIVDGAIRSRVRWRVSFGHCKGWPERWAEEVSANRSDLALVTLGAWEVFDLRRDAGDLTFGSPEHVAYLRAQLATGVQALRSTGAMVGLVEVPCFRPVDGGGLKALPERGEAARRDLLNSLLDEAAAADPTHVVVLASPRSFCTDDDTATDVNLRWDGVHYSRPGAAFVWERLAPEIRALRVPGS